MKGDKTFSLKMRAIPVCLHADGDESIEKEKLLMQQKENNWSDVLEKAKGEWDLRSKGRGWPWKKTASLQKWERKSRVRMPVVQQMWLWEFVDTRFCSQKQFSQ